MKILLDHVHRTATPAVANLSSSAAASVCVAACDMAQSPGSRVSSLL